MRSAHITTSWFDEDALHRRKPRPYGLLQTPDPPRFAPPAVDLAKLYFHVKEYRAGTEMHREGYSRSSHAFVPRDQLANASHRIRMRALADQESRLS